MKIINNKTDKLDYLNKDVQSVGNSSIDIMKRGDSKVKITFDKNF
jgi:negative regulator of replication initiation